MESPDKAYSQSAIGVAPSADGTSTTGLPSDSSHKIRPHVVKAVEEFSERFLNPSRSQGMLTGFTALDEMTGGLRPGNLHLIASRPAGGKSTLLLNILETVCLDQNTPSLLFCSDLAPQEVAKRMIFGRASFALGDCKLGYMPTVEELKKAQKASAELGLSDLLIHDHSDLTSESIAAIARKAHAEKPIGFIAIDHLHSIPPSTPGMSAKAALSQTVAGLKSLARELNVPILATAHLRRSAWQRQAGIEDLRHGTTLAYEADFICVLQPVVQVDGCDHVVCSVAKNNNGRCGDFDLYHASSLQRFCKQPVPNAEERERIRDWNDYVMERDYA